MSQCPPDYWTPIANIASVIVAIFALGFAIRSDRRSREEFRRNLSLQQENLKLQREIGVASVHPIVSLNGKNGEDEKSLELKNTGLGAAIITKVIYERDGQEDTRLLAFLNLPVKVDLVTKIAPAGTSIAPGDTLPLFKLTKASLRAHHVPSETINKVFQKLPEIMSDIIIKPTGKDVLGNPLNTVPVRIGDIWGQTA